MKDNYNFTLYLKNGEKYYSGNMNYKKAQEIYKQMKNNKDVFQFFKNGIEIKLQDRHF